MKESKNIEKLFQEKFDLLEGNPPPHIWENIAKQLQKKKNKRILPIWFQYGAVASLAIIVGLGIYFISSENTETTKVPENQVVIDDDLNDVQKKKINSLENEVEVENQELANPEEKLNDFNLKNSQNTEVGIVDNSTNTKSNKVVSTENSNIRSNSNKNLIVKENEKVIVNNSNKKQKKTNKQDNNLQKFEPLSNDLVSETSNKKISEDNEKVLNQDLLNLKNEMVFTDDRLKTNIDLKVDKESNSMTLLPIENFLDSSIQKTQQDLKTYPETNNLNPVAIEEAKPNVLEDLLKEKEREKTEDVVSKRNKWEIQSNVAPVYFNSLAEGSTIDSEFAGNDKTYQTNFSIGLGVQYAVNNKLSIRTGVNRFSLGYNTNDVAFGANFQGKTLEHVNHSAIGATISVKKIVVSENNIQETFSSENTGYLNQRIGYFEVPFEMSYQMLDKKLGISIIGGMSSLFLVENQISVVSTDFSTPIGEANNLNNLSFSTNIGFGFDYPFWKSFHAHFEPVLKYQLNTFNSNVAGFKPFFVGLYTGISYRF